MTKGLLSNPIFHDADKAREWLEARIWKGGRVCPHCGVVDQSTLMQGKTTRPGLYQCNVKECRQPFTVTVGTLYERSKIPLNKWLAATQLLMSSKKGMSALQIGRMLGISPKSSWFLMHRIRESLRATDLAPMGGIGKTVEADETFVGGKEKNKHKRLRNKKNIGGQGKETVFSLVERGGKVRSQRVASVKAATLRPILVAQIDAATKLYTDDAGQYRHMHKDFDHAVINHSIDEYVRGDCHTNTIEGYFSIMKRGITGVYHHVSPQHLPRYLAEFDYRYNERSSLEVDDALRMEKSVTGIVGKRLTYRRTCREGRPVRG
jgi:transposase-like protein